MRTLKEIDRNLSLLVCEMVEVYQALKENPGLTTAKRGRIAALQRRQEGLQRQISWWQDQRKVQQLVEKSNGHRPITGSNRVVFVGPERLNGNGRKADRSVRVKKLAKSRRDAALRASMRGHNAAPPKFGWRKSKHKRGQAA